MEVWDPTLRTQRPCQTALHGKQSPGYDRHDDGPRNYLRLYVKTKDKVVNFEEVSNTQELTKEELGKNASAAVLEQRLRFAGGADGTEKRELDLFGKLKAEMAVC